MEQLNNSRERILYCLRDKGDSTSKEIADNVVDLDRDAVNFRIKKLRNLGFIKSYDDRKDTPKGGREPVKIHSANLNKIDKYEAEYDKLTIPEYKKDELINNVEDEIIKLEKRVDTVEQNSINNTSKIEELEEKVDYIMNWISKAQDYMQSFRIYYNQKEESDYFEFLDSVKEKIDS